MYHLRHDELDTIHSCHLNIPYSVLLPNLDPKKQIVTLAM